MAAATAGARSAGFCRFRGHLWRCAAAPGAGIHHGSRRRPRAAAHVHSSRRSSARRGCRRWRWRRGYRSWFLRCAGETVLHQRICVRDHARGSRAGGTTEGQACRGAGAERARSRAVADRGCGVRSAPRAAQCAIAARANVAQRGDRSVGAAGARAAGRAAIPRFNPAPDCDRRRRVRVGEGPVRGKSVSAMGACRLGAGADHHLRNQFPSAPFRPLGSMSGIDVLVAGCGTGRHPIEVARKYKDVRVLAIDLSLTSLCYAKRKTPAPLAGRIEYAQADILKLGSIERTFDLIDASGVLHHLADPLAGWRALLSLLRPGGFMRVGLYSELARRGIVAARDFIAVQGYRPTAQDIRRSRQDLLNSPLNGVAKAGDFFSTSECRDLLFHIQERRLTIADIKSFIVENHLTFIGFEFAPAIMQHYRDIFGGDRFTRDLDRWHAFETERPDTFASMYQFWVQKN